MMLGGLMGKEWTLSKELWSVIDKKSSIIHRAWPPIWKEKDESRSGQRE